jgi:hypothetical protein
MRACLFALFLAMAVVWPKTGSAQVYQFRTSGILEPSAGAPAVAAPAIATSSPSAVGTSGPFEGPATTLSAVRFVPVGEYRGFPVSREKTAEKDAIWITVVKDGPVAPYVRR